ncbi:hypothetical protein DM02DRAFT_662326 [Periconia macrospinosa]|uniref:Zn(2)-C6 fungal-type domain-containing protein n=1 Tax=Periconia macrospinosa TaxID=97972 RepID=A0A2V1D4W7_9PLEO|nr:hypothetical protein DM02DRAFT_662326 [Periconia macrospinosa]
MYDGILLDRAEADISSRKLQPSRGMPYGAGIASNPCIGKSIYNWIVRAQNRRQRGRSLLLTRLTSALAKLTAKRPPSVHLLQTPANDPFCNLGPEESLYTRQQVQLMNLRTAQSALLGHPWTAEELCDEKKPRCSPCLKGNRQCTYTGGNPAAFVVEDPTQYSKHGKAQVAPLVYPILAQGGQSMGRLEEFPAIAAAAPSGTADRAFQITSEKYAGSGGVYRTLALPPRQKQDLQIDTSVYSMAGHWKSSLLRSLFFREQNFSNRKVALRSKAKALRALQLEVDQCRTRQTYDTAIAMKIHFAAEIMMGITDFFHAIHTIALGQILRQGPLANSDDSHFWSLVDNTYGEDVSEALVASRPSIYDNEFWINMTQPSAIPHDAPIIQKTSMGIMHVAIRLPRLVCLVRHIMEHPEDTKTVAMAISLAETLWLVDPIDTVNQLLNNSTTRLLVSPSQEIADIISDSIYFDSVLAAVQASRFWASFVSLCGVTETLYLNFPEYYVNSSIPDIADVYKRDEYCASSLARCIPYALAMCPELPILPLRIYTTFQMSVGTWHRLSRRLKIRLETCEPFETEDLISRLHKADRMVDWVMEECNKMHDTWKVQRVSRELLLAAVEDMAGGPVHYWLPRAVSFEAEDGEMVMRLQYGIPLPSVSEDGSPQIWDRSTTTRSPFENDDSAGKILPPSFLNNPVRMGPEVRHPRVRTADLQAFDEDIAQSIETGNSIPPQFGATYTNLEDFRTDLQMIASYYTEGSNTLENDSI